MASPTGYRKQPNVYSGWFFHLLRVLQVISAFLATGVLLYFVRHLWTEKLPIPWMFIYVCSYIFSYTVKIANIITRA